MMPREKTQRIRRFLLDEVDAGESKGLAARAAREFGLSRSYTSRLLRGLVEDGLVSFKGDTSARVYSLVGTARNRAFQVADLDEHRVWAAFVEPHIPTELRANVRAICQHGVTEMVNNVADHSGGETCDVRVRYDAVSISIAVNDDGIGIWEKIRSAFDLDDERHAALELAKGKLTTDPSRHTGEGVFFTTRMFNSFTIRSGSFRYFHSRRNDDWVFEEVRKTSGTRVSMMISRRSTRTIQSVFDRFAGPDEYSFNITHVPVKLSIYGQENLISRSQAKRLLARVDKFTTVYLDFGGVEMIGQAFADEAFRVFPEHNPAVSLLPMNANSVVRRMITRAQLGVSG